MSGEDDQFSKLERIEGANPHELDKTEEVNFDTLPKELEKKLRAHNDGVIELTQE